MARVEIYKIRSIDLLSGCEILDAYKKSIELGARYCIFWPMGFDERRGAAKYYFEGFKLNPNLRCRLRRIF